MTLSAERRPEILEICREADVLVLEDNPYGLLGFDEEPYRALRADEADGVIYLGSFSKTFAPGFRVGWALAPHAVREKLVLAQESATLCPPSFSPAGGLGLPRDPRLAGAGQAVPRDVPRAARRDGRARSHDMMPRGRAVERARRAASTSG